MSAAATRLDDLRALAKTIGARRDAVAAEIDRSIG